MLLGVGCNPNTLNKDNWSMLHIAARRGQWEGIKWASSKSELGIDFSVKGGLR